MEECLQSSTVSGDPSTRADVTETQATALVRRLYGLTVTSCLPLASYDDLNFHVHVDDVTPPAPHGFVLKILNALDSRHPDTMRWQHKAMFHAAERGVPTPTPRATLQGEYFCLQRLPSCAGGEADFLVRLLNFIPGTLLADVIVTPDLCRHVGEFAARLDLALQELDVTGYRGASRLWNLEQVPNLRPLLHAVPDHQRHVVTQVIDAFERDVLQNGSTLRKGLIHSDFNEHNLLLEGGEQGGPLRLCGLLDWGDSLLSRYVFEAAIPMAYLAMLACKNAIERLGLDRPSLQSGTGHNSCSPTPASNLPTPALRTDDNLAGQQLKMAGAGDVSPGETDHYQADLLDGFDSNLDLDPREAAGQVLQGYTSFFPLTHDEVRVLRTCVCARVTQSLVIGAYGRSCDPDNAYLGATALSTWPTLRLLWRSSPEELAQFWRPRTVD